MFKHQSSHTKGISICILLILLVTATALFLFLQFSDFTQMEQKEPTATTPSPTLAPTKKPAEEGNLTTVLPSTTNAENATQTIATQNALPTYPVSEQRVTLKEGFYYEPVSGNTALMERIRTLSYNETINTQVPFEVLCYVRVKYIDFYDQEQEGELICHNQIAQDLVEIFYDLYQARYQIQSIRLIDDFGADDNASMEANNTSCFNYRYSTGSTEILSPHSYGTAIDINPLYNPYVTGTYEGATVIPASAAAYADRTQDFAHKIDEDNLCYQLFMEHGFTWGGSWTTVKDYQHFEKEIGY